MMEKYGWDETTFNLIDWESHGRAMKTYKKVQIVGIHKYIHGWQHTNERKYLINQKKYTEVKITEQTGGNEGINFKKTNVCSQCGEKEDRKHIFECKSPRMKKARRHGWRTLKSKMKRYTDRRILHHIWQGVTALWNQHQREDGPIYSQEEEKINECVIAQDNIGWDQIFYGRIAHQWGVLNRKLMTERTRSLDRTTWATKMIKELINIGMGLWRERNACEHGKTLGISLEDRDVALQIIHVLYDKVKPIISPQDTWLFQKSEKQKIQDKYHEQVAWITAVKRICKGLIEGKNIQIPALPTDYTRRAIQLAMM